MQFLIVRFERRYFAFIGVCRLIIDEEKEDVRDGGVGR